MDLMTAHRREPIPSALGLVVFGAATAAASVVAALTVTGTANRYESLDLPVWAPPSWLFGPVWTMLYVTIAIAGWLAWRHAGTAPSTAAHSTATALAPYCVQLVLNAAWTPIFFGAGRYGWAGVDIVALWVAIAITIATFSRVHRRAAFLLVPYWLWVTYAAALNWSIWWNNR